MIPVFSEPSPHYVKKLSCKKSFMSLFHATQFLSSPASESVLKDKKVKVSKLGSATVVLEVRTIRTYFKVNKKSTILHCVAFIKESSSR